MMLGLVLMPLLAACAAPAASPPIPAPTSGAAPMAPTGGASAAPAAAPPTAPPAPSGLPIKLGYQPASTFAPAFLALEKGYFREQGIDVSLELLPGGTDMVTQTATGNVDSGIGGIGAGMYNALARGIRLSIVAPVTILKPPSTNALVGSKQLQDRGELQSIAYLRGRRVSILSRGGSNEYVLDLALRKSGLLFRDIDVQVLPASEAVTALANGATAAGLIPEPFAYEAIARGAGVMLTNDFIDNFMVVAMYFNETFAQTRREDGIRLLTAFYKAMRDLQPPFRDEDVAIISQYTRLSPETIRAAAPPAYDPSGDLHVADLEAVQRFAMALGDTTYQEPLPLSQFVDKSFSEAALQRLGAARR
jgi:NitT/TauT family transport system substrate-binding protein